MAVCLSLPSLLSPSYSHISRNMQIWQLIHSLACKSQLCQQHTRTRTPPSLSMQHTDTIITLVPCLSVTFSPREVQVMCLALLIKLIQGFTLWPAVNPTLKNTTLHKEDMWGESTLWCHKNTSLGPATVLIRPAFAHLALPVKGASTQQPPVYAHRWLLIRGSVPSALSGRKSTASHRT